MMIAERSSLSGSLTSFMLATMIPSFFHRDQVYDRFAYMSKQGKVAMKVAALGQYDKAAKTAGTCAALHEKWVERAAVARAQLKLDALTGMQSCLATRCVAM
jgi:hypothetical protein